MEKEIIDKIYHLYRSHIATLIIFVLLCCIGILVSIGVMKFGLIRSRTNRILLFSIVLLCSVLLPMIQLFQVIPVYADYRESSYMILDHATMTITTDSSGIIDRTNQVVVVDANGNDYHLKLQSDFLLDRGISYTGTIVYLKHSGYVIWYDLNP